MGHSSTTLFNNIRVTSNEEQDDVDAFLTKRCDTLMNIGFQSDMTPQERAEVVNEYRRALRHFPKWVLAKAIDRAVGSSPSRPTPGHIGKLATEITADIAREGKRVKRQEEAIAEHRAREARRAEVGDKTLEADLIVERAGFTAARAKTLKARPLISSFEEADKVVDTPRRPHWTENEAPDSPRMMELRKAREGNPLIAEAQQARKGTTE